MKVIVQQVDCVVPDKIKVLFVSKLLKLGIRYDWILSSTVFFKIEKEKQNRDKLIELILSVPGPDILVSSREETFQLAMNSVIKKTRKNLEKFSGIYHAHPEKSILK